ncbi:hypothetical protein PHPALM_27780 [Phytophthora palmivora]|uniref:Uncharacterized protein n=1 Tax=Phytophthora palmivora TaxID=4796 RepID=A0A2P4XBU3_9STRA|nr:hypothetical protein PHPALM_27780 [Phytophthora palmivora]
MSKRSYYAASTISCLGTQSREHKLVSEMMNNYLKTHILGHARWVGGNCDLEPLCTHLSIFIPADITRKMGTVIMTASYPDPQDDRIRNRGVVLDLVAFIEPKIWKCLWLVNYVLCYEELVTTIARRQKVAGARLAKG